MSPGSVVSRRSPFVVLLALALTCATAGTARAAAPIEGVWIYGNGHVRVDPVPDGSFTGTVVDPIKFGSCYHRAGEQMWGLTASGTSYTGTHLWYRARPERGCSPKGPGRARWDIVSNDGNRVRFCTAPPEAGDPQLNSSGDPKGSTVCTLLQRQGA